MTNWCLNKVLIKVPNNKLLKKLKNALDQETDSPNYVQLSDGRIVSEGATDLFNQLVPRPPEISEHQNFSEWEIANWGTKWDAKPRDTYWPDKYTVNFEILTALGPPIAFFENLERMGYLVNGYYLEELTGLLGVYYEGNNETYEYQNLNADQMENDLPSWVNQLFSLIDHTRSNEQEVDDDEGNDLLQGLEDLKKEFDELVITETPKTPKKSKK
jgi:hypothetical protein